MMTPNLVLFVLLAIKKNGKKGRKKKRKKKIRDDTPPYLSLV